ncbi:23S rRNA pseudouridine(955/2504/2580) synthase RluC [Marinobacter halodurans]|uniref:Pseudouridine synthase n=1 Tax=Marinobacter halodurans TaxID=2528979 RepID=A0ABY1ZGN9_9GAMM|nr:23S rRNA pseudouridine(955/2504/2580) synthase RluC [Marinobacter halodurans]TBW48054.1 23S rRNA pseudouridine(955/2504/2580) synthase RluC [Marinobacter halodurans]
MSRQKPDRKRPARQKSSRRRPASVSAKAAAPSQDASGVKAETDVAPKTSVRWATIDEDGAGQRLDNFLLTQLKGVPKSAIYRIVRKGEVRINKKRAKPDSRLSAGDTVRIPPVVTREKPVAPVPGARVRRVVEAAIIYEDERMLVVNKPQGMAVHGGSGLSFGLIEALRAARPEARFLELVHRLDRDTSGLIMVAKKRAALRHLQDEIRAKRVVKLYHALVVGHWPAGRTEVDAPLERFELRSGERMVRVSDAGKVALTRYRVLELFDGYSLVEAFPVTGRTHQIRVHCAFGGHPIAGDDKYMDDASLKAFRTVGGQRLMLHAHALELVLPDGRHQRFEAPYEEVFGKTLERLRERRGAG